MAPLFCMMALLFSQVMPATVHGPVNFLITDFSMNCSTGSFFQSLLFLGNIFVDSNQCMTWCWFLAVEFQCFSVMMLIVIAYKKMKAAGWVLLGLFVLTPIISTFIQFSANGINIPQKVIPRYSIHDNYFNLYYTQTYCRCLSYALGAIFGFIMVEKLAKIPSEFIKNPIACGDVTKEGLFEKNVEAWGLESRVPSWIPTQEGQEAPEQKLPQREVGYNFLIDMVSFVLGLALMLAPVLFFKQYLEYGPWNAMEQSLYSLCGTLVFCLGVLVLGIPTLIGNKGIA